MKNIFLTIFVLASSLYGLTLDEIITRALDKNPSLESIIHRIEVNDSIIDISNQFSNPTLSYAQNTLDDAQAMSQKILTLQQKLPFYGKRENLKKISLAEKEVLTTSLEQAKVNLVNKIKNQVYTIWELENLYKIINSYEELTKQNIELFQSYTATSDNQHMGIMSAELTLSDLRIQKSTLNAKIYSSYAKLSYLSSFEVKKIDLELSVGNMPGIQSLEAGLVNNNSISLRDKQIDKSKAVLESAKTNNYPDVNVLAAYSSRNNFDDFMTFGVGINLPIYSTEDYKEEKARKSTLVAKSLKEDTQIAVDSEFKNAYSQMKSAYEIYHIVHDEALPQIEHMFELTSSSIATGGDLFKYIDILIKKLKLEQKSIAAIASYNRYIANISSLSGELK
ncbi:TolC family protein [Candidatus Sulfurimonas marisnigri]|uniref:TolC family protein n=1 Tax=Candidatus Sulfurimonas marisnigri TaxID=2740405 RepID=A0A7S7RQM6_9BACT|nr:TolC family protein [Candidatus Sulfurimonas marisnigri]QOY54779.1 TolC family protein [Candidatus Sulfurimonas marisnigri]